MRGPGLLTAQAAQERDAPDDEQLGLWAGQFYYPLCQRSREILQLSRVGFKSFILIKLVSLYFFAS